MADLWSAAGVSVIVSFGNRAKSRHGNIMRFTRTVWGAVVQTGRGDVSNGKLILERVNLVPQMCFNLLSVSQVCNKNLSVMFTDTECLFLKPQFKIPEDLILMRAQENKTLTY